MPLCRDCNRQRTVDEIQYGLSQQKKTLAKVIFGGIALIGAGVVLGSGSVEGAVILAAAGGFPTTWKMLRSTKEERLHNNINDNFSDIKYGAGSGLFMSLIRFLVKLALATAFAVVASPILLIVNIFKLPKLRREVEENQAMLANFVV